VMPLQRAACGEGGAAEGGRFCVRDIRRSASQIAAL